MPGLPVLGTLIELLRDPPRHAERAARALGDVVDLGLPTIQLVLCTNPEHIEQILVRDNKLFHKDKGTHALSHLLGNGLLTSEGDFWRRQRRLAQPAFHRDRIAAYGEIMVAYTERAVASLTPGAILNLHAELMHLTMEIVGKTLFDADVGDAALEVGRAMENVTKHFEAYRPGLPAFIDRIPTPESRRFRRAIEDLDRITYRIVDERAGADRGDLLSMLASARDDDGSGMSPKQLRDELMTLFLAGHETTALALSWAFVLLAQNPEAEAKLASELDRVLGGRPVALEDLPSLEYTDAVVSETMRLYPPAWAVGREAQKDCTIGGYEIPKGTQVWVSQYVVQRDARFFEEPTRFSPERWIGGLAKRLPKFAYFPFGGGPRICIGNAFASMEVKLLLATIAQRRRFRLLPGHKIESVAAVTLRPKHGVWVEVLAR